MCWLKSQRSDGQLSASEGIISGPKRCKPQNSGEIRVILFLFMVLELYIDIGNRKQIFVFSGPEYKIANVIGSCCISEKKPSGENKFHERCHCPNTNVLQCKEYCDQDVNCKGYVDKGEGSCQIATTSNCPSQCRKAAIGNVGAIDQHGTCGADTYLGCYIKGNSISDV